MARLNGKTAILSGRYEILHGGHVRTIRRFGKMYSNLYIYIVSNPDSIVPNQWTKELMDYCVIDLKNVIVVIDSCHFGYATQDDLERLPKYHDFLCGNPDVATHLRGLGVNVVEFEETSGYSSTQYKDKLLQEALTSWRRNGEKP